MVYLSSFLLPIIFTFLFIVFYKKKYNLFYLVIVGFIIYNFLFKNENIKEKFIHLFLSLIGLFISIFIYKKKFNQ
jgi:hypothetical protein